MYENKGFSDFEGAVQLAKSHLGVVGYDTSAMDYWWEQRWDSIQTGLSDLGGSSEVDDFVSKYAGALGKSILQLLETQSWDVLVEIPMDYAEELLLQARSFAKMNAEIAPSDEAIAGYVQTQSHENSPMAMAA